MSEPFGLDESSPYRIIMQFAQAHMFHLLWVVVGLAVFLWWGFNYHKRKMRSFAQKDLLETVAKGYDSSKAFYMRILIVAVFLISVIALSRPQWGFEWREVKRQGLDILVVVDTSRSMLAQDIKPNRLARTKLAVKDLLKKLKGDRIGLVAFAGDAFLMCPLTADYNGFVLSLNDLSSDSIMRGGTNIGKAIDTALNGFDHTKSQYKAIIVITDGDNLEGDPLKIAKKAKEQGVKVYTIGIGTAEGELIQIPNAQGQLEFLKDSQGNVVKSRLNEKLLQQISLTTDGIYVRASGAQFGLDIIYDKDLSQLEKREMENKMDKRYYERFQIPLAVALILLIIQTCLVPRRKLQ